MAATQNLPEVKTVLPISHALLRRKDPVAAHSGAPAVRRHHPEMVGSVRGQTADICADVTESVSILTLRRSGGAVIGGGAILKKDSCRQPVRIQRAFESS